MKTFEPLSEQELDERLALAAAEFMTYRTTDFKTADAWMQEAPRSRLENRRRSGRWPG